MAIINGKSYSDSNLTIRGDQVIIDWRPQGNAVSGVVDVRITDSSPLSVQSGMDVRCIDVAGDVQAGMSVTCDDVSGDVSAGLGVSMGQRGR